MVRVDLVGSGRAKLKKKRGSGLAQGLQVQTLKPETRHYN